MSKKIQSPTSLKEIPLEGSLGLLATGDIGFLAWRAVRKEHRKRDAKESQKEINKSKS